MGACKANTIRRGSILILLIFAVMMFTGCSTMSVSTFDMTNRTESGFKRSCDYWKGNRIERVQTTEENKELTITMLIEEGSLEFKLVDAEGTEIGTEIRDSENCSDISIIIEKPGKYSLFTTGNDFKGEYEVSWK